MIGKICKNCGNELGSAHICGPSPAERITRLEDQLKMMLTITEEMNKSIMEITDILRIMDRQLLEVELLAHKHDY